MRPATNINKRDLYLKVSECRRAVQKTDMYSFLSLYILYNFLLTAKSKTNEFSRLETHIDYFRGTTRTNCSLQLLCCTSALLKTCQSRCDNYVHLKNFCLPYQVRQTKENKKPDLWHCIVLKLQLYLRSPLHSHTPFYIEINPVG